MNRIFGRVAVFLFFSCIFFPAQASAFALSPLRTSVVIDPGKEDTVYIIVKNNETEKIRVEPFIDAFSIDEQTEKAVWGESDIAKRWIESNTKEVVLSPGEEKKLTFRIQVPFDAEPGAHYLGLFAQKKVVGTQISASTRIGSLLFLYVGGTIVEKFTKDSFYISNTFYTRGPVLAFSQFSNKGSIHVVPEGKVTLKKGIFTKRTIEEIDVNPTKYKVLPHITWNKEYQFNNFQWNDIGWYTIDLEVISGIEGNKEYGSVSFFYCSKIVLSVIFSIVFFVGVFFLFWRKNRKKYATNK
ncbi:MAG: hypothetical protein V1848_02730 [Candidatus Magasanikbacteria bacterium]